MKKVITLTPGEDTEITIVPNPKLIRIVAPHFVAGLELGKPNRCPPIIRYMKNWSLKEIEVYCEVHGWKVEK